MFDTFDGHNDILLRLWMTIRGKRGKGMSGEDVCRLYHDGFDAHIDRVKAVAGGLKGGFFAMFVPQQNSKGDAILGTDPVKQPAAHNVTDEMFTILETLAETYPDDMAICTSHDQISAAMGRGAMAALPHIEGAEAIRPDLSNLEDYYARGLRSIGPLWSRPNAFGTGVPLSFPGNPDQGDGLTDEGVELIRAADRMNILIDLSHLNEKGFWDVAKTSTKPLVATHSNVHELCPSPRNLTAKQLAAINESGGMVGLNFASGFLREDGKKTADTGLDLLVRHLNVLVDALGEGGVALGSDFDGAIIPDAIGSAAGLPKLTAALQKAGYGNDLIEKIMSKNWLRMIKVTIG
jgi:membrane dipeptidase